ncbi:hypothetical protein VE03_10298 [Pseudogymnoascus sp. 23342-1-I1]|nr:hypothetical protein VE03_10298 [Pseudogymnoascus sp. 23342-1-I1]
MVKQNSRNRSSSIDILLPMYAKLSRARLETKPRTSGSSPIEWIAHDAIPTPLFKKWVLAILSRTRVTPSVIFLALMFIYRLKTLNPTVEGIAGTEYKLLTVALMLGNKFLDDSTYTSKVWAEVSGISLDDIRVMEIEFLGGVLVNMIKIQVRPLNFYEL